MYRDGQDRNFPIFPFFTVAGGLKLDVKLRDADLGKLEWTGAEMMQVAEKTEEIIKSDVLSKGALGIKEPDAIGIFATGKAAMFWGGQWMRTSIRAGAAAGLRPGHLPVPVRDGRRPEAGPQLDGDHADGQLEEQEPGAGVRDDQGDHRRARQGDLQQPASGISPNGPIYARVAGVPDVAPEGPALPGVPEAPADRHHAA